MPPKRGRPRGSTTSKLLHFSNHQRSESKKRKSFDKEVTPTRGCPQEKKNNGADDKKEDKIPKDKPTGQTKESNKSEEEEKMETEPSDNNKKVILEYDGINITKEDKDTLKQGEFLSDNIISFSFAVHESKYKEKMCNKGIVLVRPDMAHLLKNADRPTARQQMKALGIDKAKRVIIPINNSEQLEEYSSGSHWTILEWDRESNTFFHIDSLPGQNVKHAKYLASDLLDGSMFDNTGNLQARFIELEEYGRQKNGYDCGLYVIYNALAIIKNLADTESFDNLKPDPEEINQLRKSLDNQIENEIKLKENTCRVKQNSEKNDKPEDTVNNQKPDAYTFIDKYVNNKKKTGAQVGTTKSTQPKSKKNETDYKIKKCWFYARGICRFGENCRFRHEKICNEWNEIGECNTDGCKLDHPAVCRYAIKGTCYRQNCLYIHPFTLARGRNNMPNNNRRQSMTQDISSHRQKYNQNQRGQYPRPDFAQRWNRWQNMRSRKTDTNRKKGNPNPNTSKTGSRRSYADVTKPELCLQLAELIKGIANARN